LEGGFNGKYTCTSSAKQWKGIPCFINIDPGVSIYMENSRGPRTDPWGTPQVRGATEEENCPNLQGRMQTLEQNL